uniref:tRNA (guanine(6)-N2)-methyltransferase THUMP3 isoform X2 n=1 Tax=Myxine glutinosa TaxID=7769 RepID=UPI00358E40D5
MSSGIFSARFVQLTCSQGFVLCIRRLMLEPLIMDNMSSAKVEVTIAATVPTGFELTAADEVHEKLGVLPEIRRDRGQISFPVDLNRLWQVHQLRSVDNLFTIVKDFPACDFKDDKEEALEDFQKLVSQLSWDVSLEVWRFNNSVKRKKGESASRAKEIRSRDEQQVSAGTNNELSETKEEQPSSPIELAESCKGDQEGPSSVDPARTDPKAVRFRVTCNRVGEHHSFSSMEAAREFGGAVQDRFSWKADMKNFDIEILLNIRDKEMCVGIALTEESLHRRNITHFGPTTLRSTLAYGMLRMCNLEPADVVIDPMCGTGAIPVEGGLEWPQCFHIAGDNFPMATNRSKNNVNILSRQHLEMDRNQVLPVDIVLWDASRLPLKTGSVDVCITDMPFGKRIGSKKRNWELYPSCLQEMARVCRPGSGRAVLLTHDKKCMVKTLNMVNHLWKKVNISWANVGGLHTGVFVLRRTSLAHGAGKDGVHSMSGWHRADNASIACEEMAELKLAKD